MRINFSGVADLKPVPAGTYKATLTERKLVAESKASKKPFMQLTFTIQDDDFQGRKLWTNLSLQEQSFWRVKQTLVRLGYDQEALEADEEIDVEEAFQELVGAECALVVAIEQYNNEDRNQVKQILEPDHNW